MNSINVVQENVATQSSPRILLGTPEPSLDIPTEDQNTSVPVSIFTNPKQLFQ